MELRITNFVLSNEVAVISQLDESKVLYSSVH